MLCNATAPPSTLPPPTHTHCLPSVIGTGQPAQRGAEQRDKGKREGGGKKRRPWDSKKTEDTKRDTDRKSEEKETIGGQEPSKRAGENEDRAVKLCYCRPLETYCSCDGLDSRSHTDIIFWSEYNNSAGEAQAKLK